MSFDVTAKTMTFEYDFLRPKLIETINFTMRPDNKLGELVNELIREHEVPL